MNECSKYYCKLGKRCLAGFSKLGFKGEAEHLNPLLHLLDGDFRGLRVLNAIGADDGIGFIFKRDDEMKGFWKI